VGRERANVPRSGWDDLGPSVLDTIWNVMNRNCCSARVGSSWGKTQRMLMVPAKFGRPQGDDEGAPQDDFDPDRNPSCHVDNPQQADTVAQIWRTHYAKRYSGIKPALYDNWVERPPRDSVHTGR
jgi:hypothetical protein